MPSDPEVATAAAVDKAKGTPPPRRGINLNHAPKSVALDEPRRGDRDDLDDLKAAVDLADLIERDTGARFVSRGDHADAPCPFCQEPDARDRKFRVLSGRRYKCVKCGKGGSVLDYLMERDGLDLAGAVAELRRLAGDVHRGMDADAINAKREERRRKAKEAEVKELADKARKIANARRLWAEAVLELPAKAVEYWTVTRGLPVDSAGVLRWHPSCPYKDKDDDRLVVPAILAPVTDAAGDVVGVHRIPLAPVENAERRLGLGAKQGNAVRLGHGPTLVLAEGIETAAAASKLLGLPAWAALDAGNLTEQAIPDDVVELVLVADHDEPKGQYTDKGGRGWAAAREAAAVYRKMGRSVRILTTPEPDTDANDTVLGKAGSLVELEPVERDAPSGSTVKAQGSRDGTGGSEVAPEPADAPDGPTVEQWNAYAARVHERWLERGVEFWQADDDELVEQGAPARRQPVPSRLLPGRWERDGAHETALADADRLVRREVWAALDYAKAERAGMSGDSPTPEHVLVRTSVGTGKTRGYVDEIAKAGVGGVLIATPELGLADDVGEQQAAAIKRHNSPLRVKVWRGMTQDVPGGDGERMCLQPEELVDQINKVGASVQKTLCGLCPFRDRCQYLKQVTSVRENADNLVLVASHEHAYLPKPGGFKVRVTIIDEAISETSVTLHADPDGLSDPSLWDSPPVSDRKARDGETDRAREKREKLNRVRQEVREKSLSQKPDWIDRARSVVRALREHDQEREEQLAYLRLSGVSPSQLRGMVKHLRRRNHQLIEAVEDGGFTVQFGETLRKAKEAQFRVYATLLSDLAAELELDRPFTIGTRIEEVDMGKKDGNGQGQVVMVKRWVSHRLRTLNLPTDAPVVVMDATGSKLLVEAMLGAPVKLAATDVPNLGTVLQVSSASYSKRALLGDLNGSPAKATEAKRLREDTADLIRHMYAISDGSLLVITYKDVRKLLEPVLKKDCPNIVWMHFGAHRGRKEGEPCQVGLVIGREQPRARSLDAAGRAHAARRLEPFTPAYTGRVGNGELVEVEAIHTMRDGATSPTGRTVHPDMMANERLAQVREAGIVQAAGRLRLTQHPDKLLIICTNQPTELEADGFLTRPELEVAARTAAGAVQGWREYGAGLVDPAALKVRASRLEEDAALAAWMLGTGAAGNPAKAPVGSYRDNGRVSAVTVDLRGGARGPARTAWLLTALEPVDAVAAAKAAGFNVTLPKGDKPATASVSKVEIIHEREPAQRELAEPEIVPPEKVEPAPERKGTDIRCPRCDHPVRPHAKGSINPHGQWMHLVCAPTAGAGDIVH